MPAKPLWASATIRANLVLLAAALAGMVASRERGVSAALALCALAALLNLWLRLQTRQPVSLHVQHWGGIDFEAATSVTGEVAGGDIRIGAANLPAGC